MVRRKRPASEAKPVRVLDVCVHGQAVSGQTTSRTALEAWKRRIRSVCAAEWTRGAPLSDAAIGLRVTFFRQSELGDLDNLLKPVHDALQGIAYHDERQISEVTSRRRDINSALKVRYMSPSVAMALSDGRQFVHIEVWIGPDQETIG